jgi:hypothetical protein
VWNPFRPQPPARDRFRGCAAVASGRGSYLRRGTNRVTPWQRGPGFTLRPEGIDVWNPFRPQPPARDPHTVAALAALTQEIRRMAGTMADLQAAVTRNTTVTSSALTLIQGLSAQLKAAQGDPAAIQAVIEQLDNADTGLAAAVAANTPAAPTPPPTA